jgi:tRNA pseudouridine55 synthase
MTSFRVVALIKRLTGERRAGHAGTLDPEASGVLPVCLGQATRVIEFLFADTKTYLTEVELGVTTDSYDSAGKIVATKDTSGITRDMVEAMLARFRGRIMQTPPMFSAIKLRGRPLYELARAGIQVERKSRPAYIHNLDIVDWRPPILALNIVCGKGTYIRSLAHDLGEALGSGANVKSLVRLKVGPFRIEEALTIQQIEEICQSGDWRSYLHPLDYILLDFPVLVVKKAQQCALIHGAYITLESDIEAPTATATGTPFRVYSEDGSFVGMVKYNADDQHWQPEKIFMKKCCEKGPEGDSDGL